MNTSAPILLVEDDENDVFFLKRALKQIDLPNPLMVVRNGLEALRYLQGEGVYSDRQKYPEVRLVLLDISLPIMNGLEFLEILQRQPIARDLVVVVLSSSSNPGDIEKATFLGAVEYLVKPTNAMELPPMIRALLARWLTPTA